MEFSELRTTTLSRPDRLVIEIERLIIGGRLAVGSRLPAERELAKSLGVSRTSLRDALSDLERRGFLERTPGRGTIVQDPTTSADGDTLLRSLEQAEPALTHTMEVRACVEPSIAFRAALTVTDRDVEALRALIDEQVASKTTAAFVALDRTFHRSIAVYTKNPLLIRLIDNVNELVEPSRQLALQTTARRRTSIAEHRAIFEAISARDPEAAQRAAAAHVASLERRLLGRGQGPAAAPPPA